jgi:hypothetical protein
MTVHVGLFPARSDPAVHDVIESIIDLLFYVSHFGRTKIIWPLLGTSVVIVSCRVKSA